MLPRPSQAKSEIGEPSSKFGLSFKDIELWCSEFWKQKNMASDALRFKNFMATKG
jgi:hypothetical protein